MKNNYYVYKHTSPNGKVYIGITIRKPEKRWGSNGINYRTQVFYRAIQKYGWDNIKHEILFEGLSKEEAEQKEIELIALYHSNDKDFGYNIDNGGHCLNSFSEEHKRKISDSKKGKPRDAETIRKVKEALTGRKMPEEQRRKIAEINKNRKFSDEALKRISESSRNRKYTKEQMEYRKQMIRKARSYPVCCVEIDMTFDSVPEAVEYIKSIGGIVAARGIRSVLKGEFNTSGRLVDGTRLHWRPIDK